MKPLFDLLDQYRLILDNHCLSLANANSRIDRLEAEILKGKKDLSRTLEALEETLGLVRTLTERVKELE